MRIVTWNIRHGGAKGESFGLVIETLLGFDADLLVVTEFRAHTRGDALVAGLQAAGYQTSHAGAPPGRNSVLIASRTAIVAPRPLDATLTERWRLWTAAIGQTRVAGIYLPNGKLKLPYWDAILAAITLPGGADLLIGDFNTGRNDVDKADRASPFIGSEYMGRIAAAGFIDLWRMQNPEGREYSWFSRPANNGFRLDHAFGTARIAAGVKDCRYDHAPRLLGVSDHSALVLEVDAGSLV